MVGVAMVHKVREGGNIWICIFAMNTLHCTCISDF